MNFTLAKCVRAFLLGLANRVIRKFENHFIRFIICFSFLMFVPWLRLFVR